MAATYPVDDAATKFFWPVRVYYEDTDATGVVYHARYLNYFERARTEWLRSLGFTQESLRKQMNLAFTVVRAQVHYKLPARLDDELQVSVRLCQRRAASLMFTQDLTRNETLLAQAQVRVACISADDFKPCALPNSLLREMQ